MRDPQRIDRIIEKLRLAWHSAPDLRLGQLIHHLMPRTHPVWVPEDEAPERSLDEWLVKMDDKWSTVMRNSSAFGTQAALRCVGVIVRRSCWPGGDSTSRRTSHDAPQVHASGPGVALGLVPARLDDYRGNGRSAAVVLAQPVTFEWPWRPGSRARTFLGLAIADGLAVGFDPQDEWPGVLAANLAMGALLCAAHRRGWSQGWQAGVPRRFDAFYPDGEP